VSFEQASEANPESARILWLRAHNLEQAGRGRNARPLYARLARGKWDPDVTWMRDAARRRLRRLER